MLTTLSIFTSLYTEIFHKLCKSSQKRLNFYKLVGFSKNQTNYPNVQIFLHRYIHHLREVGALVHEGEQILGQSALSCLMSMELSERSSVAAACSYGEARCGVLVSQDCEEDFCRCSTPQVWTQSAKASGSPPLPRKPLVGSQQQRLQRTCSTVAKCQSSCSERERMLSLGATAARQVPQLTESRGWGT